MTISQDILCKQIGASNKRSEQKVFVLNVWLKKELERELKLMSQLCARGPT